MPFKFSAEAEQKLNTGVVNNNKPSVDKLKEKPQVKTEVKPKVETKLSRWDSDIAPILDQHPELKKQLNYNTSKEIMRVINGRYDKAMYQIKQDGDTKAFDTFTKFKNNAWALANELKKLESGGNYNDALRVKYQNNAAAYFDTLQKTFSEDKKKAYVMNDKAELLDSKSYEKYKQDPSVDKDASTSAKVVFDRKGFDELVADYETGNVSKAYQKLKGQDTYFRDKGIQLMSPITKSWVATSLNRIGERTTDSKTNEDALNLNKDILKHISTHKTTLDPELAQKDQYAAKNLLNKLKGKNVEQQYQILKENSKVINGMTKRMGYYGNAKIIDQYKKSSIGTDLNFYPAENTGKKQEDYFNMIQDGNVIDNHRRAFRDFKEADKNVRIDALDNVQRKWKDVRDGLKLGGDLNKKDMEVAFQSLVDEQGNIRSFNEWQKQLGSKLTSTTVLKDRWGYEQKYTDNTTGVVNFYNKIKGTTDPDYFVSDYNTRGNLYSQSAGDQKQLRSDMAKDRERQLDANAKQKQVWIEAYNKLKKAYKKNFDDVKVKHVYDATLMDIGFGDERNQAMSYRGVDLSVNKDMRLKVTSGPKQENINKIFNLMFDDNGNVDTENITLFSNEDVKSGLSAIQKDELKEQKNKNEDILKKFLKDKNDHITVTFLRNTNVPGQAAYKFYNPETKKSMMLFAPTAMLGNNGIKEDLYTKTGRDPLDFTFQLRGSLTMPVFKNDQGKPAYVSAELKYDKTNDEYYGETIIFDSQGNKTPIRTTIPYGSQISTSAAQRMYMNILKDQRNSF